MSNLSNNLLNQKLGLGYLSNAFSSASIDNTPHPNPRISNYKFDIINLGTLRNVIPTAVLRKNIYADTIFSKRKQWAFENIIIKNDQKIYEIISELSINFYGDYSYFAPYKIRYWVLKSNFFKERLLTRETVLKTIDRNLPYARLQFPANISNTIILTGSRDTYRPINIQNNVISSNYYVSGYNSGINYANRNTFIYRRFTGSCSASGYIPYPNTVTTWQYPIFNYNTKIALNSVSTYENMYNDMDGLLVASLRSPSGTESIVYVSPHEVQNKFYNVIIDSVRLQPSRIQTKLVGGQLKYEYAQVNSGITVNVLDIGSEYHADTGMAPTPYVTFKYLSTVALNHYPINAGTDNVSNSDIPANNILEITKPQYGIKINVSGCWGGYRAVWQSSANGVNWSRFDLNLENIPSGTYTISEAIPPKYLRNWFGFQNLLPDSCITVASYTGFLPTGHKFLRIVNPSQNLISADTKFPLDNPTAPTCRLDCGGAGGGGGDINVSVSSANPGRRVFEPGLIQNPIQITGYSYNGVPLYGPVSYSAPLHLQQTTPLKDTWFYRFYSGLYTSSKTIATGTWNGIIPSGHSITLEYITTKDGRAGTNNDFRFVLQNYGNKSSIDNIFTNTFTGSTVRRGFSTSSNISDAIDGANGLLRKGINNSYLALRKSLPTGILIFPENAKVRRFRNLYTTSIYDYATVENIPSGAFGCFKLSNKQIVCIDPPLRNCAPIVSSSSSSSSFIGSGSSGSSSSSSFIGSGSSGSSGS